MANNNSAYTESGLHLSDDDAWMGTPYSTAAWNGNITVYFVAADAGNNSLRFAEYEHLPPAVLTAGIRRGKVRFS